MKILPYILFLCLFIACGDESEPEPMMQTITVSIDPISVLEGDEDKSAFASIRLSAVSTNTVTIFVESQDGTAKAGVDYEAISQSVEFTPGDVQENIRMNIFGDDDSELDEDFTLNIVNITGATIGNGTATITIENDDLGSGNVIIPSTGYSTPESYDGWNLIWSDEFNGPELNETYWRYETGNGNWGWGNNELQFYKRDNTSIVDGHLVIEALNENFNGFGYTSSRIKTEGKFDFMFGRVDIRAVLPEGQGIWPALWMLGTNISTVGWPRCGEIDIMELIGHQPSTVHATVHLANNAGDHLPPVGNDISLSNGRKFIDDFHVFSIIWEEDSIRFLMDDQQYHSITKNSLGNHPYPFNAPFYFIFNVATGGIWPGSPDASTVFPQHMIVDYIRVFQEE